jgi:hypothetical protein
MSYDNDGVALQSLKSSVRFRDVISEEFPTATPNISAALSALNNPQFSAAINALVALQQPGVTAALAVLQQYSNQTPNPHLDCENSLLSESSGDGSSRKQTSFQKKIRPVFRNNLFVITVLWTLLGLFILYGSQSKDTTSIAIFAVYGIVQSTLAIFILIVTSKQVQKIQYRTVTLGFLLQGWLALVLNFAGLYLFFYHSFTIALDQKDDTYVNSPDFGTDMLTLTQLQVLTPGSRALGFASACIPISNFSKIVFEDSEEAKFVFTRSFAKQPT